MKKVYVLGAFLVLPVLFMLGWLAQIEYVLNAERSVVVRMTGYDPRDLLVGHYLYLQPDWSRTDCLQFAESRCPTERFGRRYRYYLPEFDAQELDRVLMQDDLKVEMVFSYKGEGKPLVKELLIGGKPWAEWLRQSAKQPEVPLPAA